MLIQAKELKIKRNVSPVLEPGEKATKINQNSYFKVTNFKPSKVTRLIGILKTNIFSQKAKFIYKFSSQNVSFSQTLKNEKNNLLLRDIILQVFTKYKNFYILITIN